MDMQHGVADLTHCLRQRGVLQQTHCPRGVSCTCSHTVLSLLRRHHKETHLQLVRTGPQEAVECLQGSVSHIKILTALWLRPQQPQQQQDIVWCPADEVGIDQCWWWWCLCGWWGEPEHVQERGRSVQAQLQGVQWPGLHMLSSCVWMHHGPCAQSAPGCGMQPTSGDICWAAAAAAPSGSATLSCRTSRAPLSSSKSSLSSASTDSSTGRPMELIAYCTCSERSSTHASYVLASLARQHSAGQIGWSARQDAPAGCLVAGC